MKNTIKVFGIIAFIAVFTFSAATCSAQSGSGGKALNSPEALKEYLDSQPANSPDKPIKVSMGANELMIPKIVDVLNSAGKYVSLNITGNALTKIPNNAFYECKTLVGITIPNSVISIGGFAFCDCLNLSNITIPNSVISIGNGAFSRTAWIKNQPDGLVYVCKVAYGYKGIMPANTSITILDGTKEIAGGAFSSRKELTSIILPNSVINIGESAFYHCTNLASITIPNSVVSIEPNVFYNCYNLTSITIPNSVTSIGFLAFASCDSLTSVTFQGTISKIDSEAFGKWSSSGYIGDLREKYLAEGIGTYTRPNSKSKIWTKN